MYICWLWVYIESCHPHVLHEISMTLTALHNYHCPYDMKNTVQDYYQCPYDMNIIQYYYLCLYDIFTCRDYYYFPYDIYYIPYH